MSKKINLNSVINLRNECDEHLFPVFNKLGYEESFILTDIKLIIGYLSVASAALLYYLDKKFKNDFTNATYVNYTIVLVCLGLAFEVSWFLVNKFVTKSIKFQGVKGSKKLTVSTYTKSKSDPVYYVDLQLDNSQVRQVQVKFSQVFNSDGFLEYAEFEKLLQGFVTSLEKQS